MLFKNHLEFINFVSAELPSFLSREVRLFIACQFALESDFGTSKLAVRTRNLCGMCFPKKRVAYNIGELHGFSVYSTSLQCIYDYVLYLSWQHLPRNCYDSVSFFAAWLERICYCPDKDYVSRISKIYSQFSNQLNF